MYSTYSFADTSLVLSHPKVGKIVLGGQGLGSVTISRAADSTQHDIAADGSAMTSKIIARNGSLSLSIQQTSPAQQWLRKWYAYLVSAPASEWAQTNAVFSSQVTGERYNISGVSPQRAPDAVFRQAGQQVTWTLMATDVSG